MTSIDKKAEEMAREFNEAGHLKYDADEKPLATLIAAALRKERQEAACAATDWLIVSSLYFMPEEADTRNEDIESLRTAILKED